MKSSYKQKGECLIAWLKDRKVSTGLNKRDRRDEADEPHKYANIGNLKVR